MAHACAFDQCLGRSTGRAEELGANVRFVSPGDQIALVQQALGALAMGDLETAASLAVEGVVWRVPGRSRIAGDAVGLDAVRNRLQMLLSAGVNIEVLNVMSAGDQVVTVQRNSGAVEGRELDITVLNLTTISDGKIGRIDTFPSDVDALDRFWGTT